MDADALQIRQALMKSLRAEFQKQEMRDKQNKELSTQTIKFLKQLSSGDGGTMALSAHFDDYVTYEKERNKITDKWEKRTVVLLEDILDALLESCGCKKERQSGGGGVGFGLGLVGAEIYEMMKNIRTAVRKAATNIEKDAEKEFEELKNTVDNEFKGISDGASKEIKSLKDSAVSDFKKIRTAIEDEIDKVLKKLGLQPSTPDAKPSPKPGILPKIEGGIKKKGPLVTWNIIPQKKLGCLNTR